MAETRYRAVYTHSGNWCVFDGSSLAAKCLTQSIAERIAAALNEMEERSDGDE